MLSELLSYTDSRDSTISHEKESSLKNYVSHFMAGMEYVGCIESYSLVRYILKCTNPKMMGHYKNNRTLLEIGAVLDSSKVAICIEGRMLYIDETKEKADILRIRRGIEELSNLEKTSGCLDMYIGDDTEGNPVFVQLNTTNSNMLVAGNTGSGKTVSVHNLLISLASRYDPTELQIFASDIKKETFRGYFSNPNSIFKKEAHTRKDTYALLAEIEDEMNRRVALFDTIESACNGIQDYNEIVGEGRKLPVILLIIEEADNLFTGIGNEVEENLSKNIRTTLTNYAKKYRSYGLKILIISQRPNSKTMGTDLRDQLTTRVAFHLEKEASKMVLNSNDATVLSTGGDAILKTGDNRLIRIHTAYIEREELNRVHAYLRNS